MLEYGIIRPSRSPYSSPILLVPKPNKTKRLVVDYRQLNAITVQQNWPLPLIADILDDLSGASIFSQLDLKSGYWQVAMNENSIEQTAFSTPDGHYEFLRLPFGLRNAPAEFSRIMYMVLGHLTFVKIYLDDVTVFSKTIEEHIEHLKVVFELLNEAGLKMNPEKCFFCQSEIKLLGYIVSGREVKVDPAKIEKVKNRTEPKNVKDVQRFLGLCNYYRRFVKGFAEIASPLNRLLKKDVKFVWSKECQQSFDTLKEKLTSYPIVKQPDFKREFWVFTDASKYAVGAILSQKDDTGNECVIAYASRSLKGAEINYVVTEQECLAVLFAIKQFRIYLYGTHFKVITDHNALNWLMRITDPTGRLARWAIYLQVYNFEIIHRKGVLHSNADALSRPPDAEIESLYLIDIEKVELDVYKNEHLKKFVCTGWHMTGASKKQVKKVETLAKHYYYSLLENEVYYRKNTQVNNCWIKVPKLTERTKIIEKYHLQGHFQAQSTFVKVRRNHFWCGMMEDVKRYIKNCGTCQRNQHAPVFEHPAKTIEVTRVFERIGIDLVFGLPETSDGYIGLMVITEYLTKYPYAVPIKSKTACEIAENTWQYISLFGPPKIILTDQGRDFNNSVMDKLVKNVGAEHVVTSAYHPRTNGQTERFNSTLVNTLRKHAENNVLVWDKWLPYVLYCYRTRVHTTTNVTPFKALFGVEMNEFDCDQVQTSKTNLRADLENRSLELNELMTSIHPTLIDNIKKSKLHQTQNQNKSTKHLRIEQLPIGSKVYLVNDGLLSKLENRYSGPYIVCDVSKRGNYYLRDSTGYVLKEAFPLNKLKIITETSEVENRSDKTHFEEVEKILAHKMDGNEMKFLVKWRNRDESHNEWKSATDFNTKEVINKYLKSNNKKEIKVVEDNAQRQKRGRGRPRKGDAPVEPPQPVPKSIRIRNRLTKTSAVISMLTIVFALIFGLVADTKLPAKLNFCTINDGMEHISLDSICEEKQQSDELKIYQLNKWLASKPGYFEQKETQATKIVPMVLLNKRQNSIVGSAFQCEMIKTTKSFVMTLFGDKFETNTIEEVIKLSEFDCWNMVTYKACHFNNKKFHLTCDSKNECEFNGRIDATYAWWSTVKKETFTCKLKISKFIAQSIESNIFNTKCQVKQLYCSLSNSIIVWKKDVLDMCPFDIITNVTEMSIKGKTISTKKLHIGLIFSHVEKNCNTEMIYTEEGLYVTLPKLLINTTMSNFTANNVLDGKAINELMLADSDYYKITESSELKQIKAAECKMLKLILASFKLSNNKFLITKNAGDNEIVLYTKGGMLYKPDCLVVNEITLFNKSTNCYDSIPVQIQLNNKSHNVFLSSDGILLNTAKINTECELKQTVEVNSNYSVIRDGLQYYIQNKSNIKRNTKIIELTIDENIEHFELVKNEISFMSSEKELTINEQFGDIQVVSDNEISQITDINSFPAIIANLESCNRRPELPNEMM